MGFVELPVLLVQACNFALIFFVLHRFVFKPLGAYLAEQEKKERAIDDAKKEVEIEKRQAAAAAKQVLEKAKADSLAMKENIVSLAQKEAEDIVERAKKEASDTKASAMGDLNREREALYSELEGKILKSALTLNQKLFGKNEANEAFLKESAQKI